MMVCYVLTIIYITLYLAIFYLVKFLDDGVVSMKSEDDLEHVEVPPDGRMSFLIGDIVNTEWELDGEMYEAEIIEVGSKLLNSCIYAAVFQFVAKVPFGFFITHSKDIIASKNKD